MASLLFQGDPLKAPNYAATTTDVPQWLQDYTVDLFSQQRAVSGTPYTPYTNPLGRIAQTTAPTTQAQNLITSSVGAYQPAMQNAITGTQGLTGQGAGTTAGLGYLQQAAGMSGVGAAQPYLTNAGQTATANIGQYMNPYTQNVTDQIAKLGARNLSENLLPAVSDQFIRAGQFGSSGMGTFGGRALRDTQEAILNQQNQALQSGYTQALGASQADLARQAALGQTAGQLTQAGQQNLGTIGAQTASTAQAEAQRQAQAQQQVADLAKMQQGLTTADAAALESVGAAQQQQQQRGLDVAYQDYQNQLAYPQNQINAMSTTLRGLPANATPTASTQSGYTTTFSPSPLSDIAAAYGVYKGLTAPKAKGGLIQGYAAGGAVSGGDDNLLQSVMSDYGQYINPGYAEGGTAIYDQRMALSQPAYDQGKADMAARAAYYAAHPAIGSPDSPTAINRGYTNATKNYNTAIDAYNKDNNVDIYTPKEAYYSALDKYLMSNSRGYNPTVYSGLTAARGTRDENYRIADEDNNDYSSADADYRTQLDELAKTISKPVGKSTWGNSMPHLAHGGRVPGYAQEGYVDTENPADLVDGGQAFADQYAAMQQQYPTQQDMPMPVAQRAVPYTQSPEILAANAERKALLNQLQASLSKAPASTDYGPSESEKWLNFAAAFSDPGKTGSFGEGMGHAASSLAAHKADQRKARALNAAADLQRLQSRSALAQQQYEMERDEGKRRMIEQYLTPKPTSTAGAAVGGQGAGVSIPDNMKAIILSLDPDEAVKTIIDIAKENNSPKTAIGGINFAVEAGIITREEGNTAIKQAIQPKVDMAKLYIPELGSDADLTQAELIKYTTSGVIPTRYTGEKPTPAQSFMANTPSSLAPVDATQGVVAPTAVPTPAVRPRTKEQVAADNEQLKEAGKKKVEAADLLLGQREAIDNQLMTVRRFKSIVNKDPSIIGLTNKPGIGAAFVEAAKQGVRIGDFPISINLEEPIAKATLNEEQLANRDFAKQAFQDLVIGYRKMFLKGEGPVSNMEGALVEKLPPGLEDTNKGFMLKAGVVEIRAEKKQAVVNGFSQYLKSHPTAGPEDYYNTPEFKRMSDTYDNKYTSFLKQNGFDLGILATPTKKPSSDKFDFNALDKDPRFKGTGR